MSNNLTKMTSLEAICLVLIVTINRVILNLPQTILNSCGSSAIINIIYISIIAIIFTLIIIKLYKNFSGSDIVDISEYIGGKFLKSIIGTILIIYLILIASVSVRNFCEVLHITYYGNSSISYLLIFFVIVSAISNFFGEQSIIRTNVIITFIMLLSILITFLSVTPNFVIQRIYPVLGYGAYSTFFSGLSNIFSFNGIICLYFIMPILSEKQDFKKIAIISIILISILLFLATSCLLLSLAFSLDIENISPIYTLISNNEFGNFIQHPESLFVFTWILSIISYLDVIVMIIIRFSKKITGLVNDKLFIIPICVIIFIIALIPKNIIETHTFENYLYKFMLFPLAFIIFPIILIVANIKFKNKKEV